MLSLRAYGRAEVQLHTLLASALDHFVPDKNLVYFNRSNRNQDPVENILKRQNGVSPSGR